MNESGLFTNKQDADITLKKKMERKIVRLKIELQNQMWFHRGFNLVLNFETAPKNMADQKALLEQADALNHSITAGRVAMRDTTLPEAANNVEPLDVRLFPAAPYVTRNAV